MDFLPKRSKHITETLIFASIIAFAVISIVIFYSWYSYNKIREEVFTELSEESNKIEISFTNTIDHTSFIMGLISKQILIKPDSLDYINSVLSRYKLGKGYNDFSWTGFSWANKDGDIVVNAIYGILTTINNIAERSYITQSKEQPGELFVGKPVWGYISQRQIIPAGMGIAGPDKQYIGSLTIGFDALNLEEIFRKNIKSPAIDFVVFTEDFDIVINSERNKEKPHKTISQLTKNELEALYKTHNSKNSHITLNDNAYYFRKINDYPYILCLDYDEKMLRQRFFSDITSRLIEINVIGIAAIILIIFIYKREIALREQAEHAKELAIHASEVKSEFLAFTAHELRTPLSFIVTGSEVMKNELFGPLSDKYKEYAANMHSSGQELIAFLDDLLDKTQLEKGSFNIHTKPANLNSLIEEAVTQNSFRAIKAKIVIEVNIEDKLPKLMCDARRMLQVFNNIISNSIKYSPQDTKITISVTRDNDKLDIIFEDQGFGMSKADVKVALSEYGTLPDRNYKKAKSVGLGLPIVKKLIEAQKGLLFIESEVDKGTKITLRFPKECFSNNSE